jgi:hypothetical protein
VHAKHNQRAEVVRRAGAIGTTQEDDMQADERQALFDIRSWLRGGDPNVDNITLLWLQNQATQKQLGDVLTNLRGNMPEGQNNFHWLAGQILTALAANSSAKVSAEAIAAAIPADIAEQVAQNLAARLAAPLPERPTDTGVRRADQRTQDALVFDRRSLGTGLLLLGVGVTVQGVAYLIGDPTSSTTRCGGSTTASPSARGRWCGSSPGRTPSCGRSPLRRSTPTWHPSSGHLPLGRHLLDLLGLQRDLARGPPRDWTAVLAWSSLGALIVSWSRCVNPPTGRRR